MFSIRFETSVALFALSALTGATASGPSSPAIPAHHQQLMHSDTIDKLAAATVASAHSQVSRDLQRRPEPDTDTTPTDDSDFKSCSGNSCNHNIRVLSDLEYEVAMSATG